MAGSDKEAKILFKAEAGEFQQAVKDANDEIKSLQAEMKLADATFKNTGDAAEYQQQKQELLQSALEENRKKQEALTQQIEVASRIYGDDSKQVDGLKDSLTYAQIQEQNLLKQVDDTNQGLDQQEQAADDAGKAADSMAEILVNAGVAKAIKDIADNALEMAQSFDEAKAAIVEGTGASGESLQGLQDAAQRAFGRIADSNQDLTSISGILAELNTRFGITGQEAEDTTVKIANFAKATGADGTKSVDAIADVMHRWGLDMDDVDGLLDDLTTANQSCQLSVDDLTGYLTSNSTQFQELGYSTEEALAMLIGLSDGGADVGSVMSGLTKGIANLSSETDDVPGAFQAAIQAISESGNVSEALQKEVGNTGKTVEQVFGKKAAQELATNIQNGSFAVEDWTKVLQDNEGSMEGTAEGVTTMGDNWSQAMNNVKMAVGSTLAPAISDVVSKVAEVVTKVAEFVQKSPEAQAAIVAVATALGILGVALGISAAITAVQKAMAILNATFFASPIFLVVTAIAALAAGLVYAYKHSEKFRKIVDGAFNILKTKVIPTVKDFVQGVVKGFTDLKNKVTTAVNNLKSSVVTIWNNIKSTVTGVVNGIKTTITNVWNGIKTTTANIWNGIKSTLSGIFNGIKSTATAAWNAIKSAVTTVVNGIKTTVTNVWNTIKTTTSSVFNAVKSAVTTVWNGIKTTISTAINGAKTTVTSVVNGIKSTVTSVFNSIKSTASSVWNGIKSAVTSPINSAKSTVSSAVNGIKSTVSSVFNSVKSTATSVWNGIKSAITTPINSAKSTVSSVIGGIKSTVSSTFNGLKSTVSSAWNGIKTSITKPIESAKTTLSNVVKKIKGIFPVNLGKILKLKLPSIHVSGGSAPWGIGGKGTKPSFSVTWNAKGVIFKHPAILNSSNGYQGVAERGPEAIAPIELLKDYVEEAVNNAQQGLSINYDLMAVKIAQACARMNINVDIDGRQLGRIVRGMI